jgi:hypothetical protein
MQDCYGAAAVEIGHHRFERRITEIQTVIVRQKCDPIDLELVEGVRQLRQCTVNVR